MQWPIPQFPSKLQAITQVNLASGAANTKGSWSTLLTGLSAPVAWVNLGTDTMLSSGDRAALLDLAIGGAGSETIVAADLVFGFRPYRGTMFPLHIPAGATLRGRIAYAGAFEFIGIQTTAFMGEPESGISVPGRITSYGAVPASSGGTTVTPSGSANVKGSYAQLTAATTAPIHAIMVLVQGGSGSLSTANYVVDIAVGGSGSETVLIPDHAVRVEDTELIYPRSPEFYPLSLSLPAGVRLAARCATNTVTTTPIELAVYGFTY